MTMILGLDCATAKCSVALWYEQEIIYAQSIDLAQQQSSQLPLMVKECFDHTGKQLKQLTHVAVTRGPGSFTGIRIGMAFAQGLAVSGNIPLLAIDTFEAMCAHETLPYVKLIDTKCGDYYSRVITETGQMTDQILTLDAVREMQLKGWPVYCDTPSPFETEGEKAWHVVHPQAETLLQYAVQKLADTQTFETRPYYMRKPAIHGKN